MTELPNCRPFPGARRTSAFSAAFVRGRAGLRCRAGSTWAVFSHASPVQSRLAHRRLERKEAAEHRLFAVEIDGVGLVEILGDLVRRLQPAIEAGRGEQAPLQSLLSRHD